MGSKGKVVVAFLYALASLAVPFIDGGRAPTAVEWTQILIAAVTAVGVYIAPIIPEATWVKSAVGFLLAGLNVLTTVIMDGVSGNDVLMIVLAALAAIGITVAPARSANGAAVGVGGDALVR